MTRLRSLRGLTLVFIAAFMAATIGTGLISYNETSRTIARLVDSRLATTADAMAPVGTAYETGELLRRMKALDDDRDTGDLGIVLTDSAGHRLGGNVALLRRLPLGFSVLRRHDRIDLPPSSVPGLLLVDYAGRRHIRAEVKRSGTGGRIWR